jgi:hypothetical protein
MTPINDNISLVELLKFLDMEQSSRLALFGTDSANNSTVGLAYDAGYLAAITNIRNAYERPYLEEAYIADNQVEEFEGD